MALMLLAVLPQITSARSAVGARHADLTHYGVAKATFQTATDAAAWPQKSGDWCGIATVAAIAAYRGSSVTQAGIADYLNSGGAVSAFGSPSHASGYWGPGFQADISRDYGTDPRALAQAMGAEAGGNPHMRVVTNGRWVATWLIVADVIRNGPVTVFVDAGLHSVVVSGVNAWGNPLDNLNNISSLEVWDPGAELGGTSGVQAAREVDVSLSSWLYSMSYLGSRYDNNWFGGYTYDPDPAVGPYTYDPAAGNPHHLWVGNFVYIAPYGPGVSADWAINQDGALIRGAHDEVPSGYSGASVPLWIPPPPTPTPLPTATPTPTPRPTPTVHPPQEPPDLIFPTPTPVIPRNERGLPFAMPSCTSASCTNLKVLGGYSTGGMLMLIGVVGLVGTWRSRRGERRRGRWGRVRWRRGG
ncbi:MAG TPA: hypothetical protein VF807_09985 [Ktedonobacterales bacterium]